MTVRDLNRSCVSRLVLTTVLQLSWNVVPAAVGGQAGPPSTPVVPVQGVIPDIVTDVASGIDGLLWLATPQGLVRYDGYTARPQALAGPLTSGRQIGFVEKVLVDGTGSVWAGLRGRGLVRVDPETGVATVYEHSPSDPATLSSNDVRAVIADRSGRIWVGTSDGVDVIDPESGELRRVDLLDGETAPGAGAGTFAALYEDSRGFIWVGSFGGPVRRIDPETLAVASAVPTPGVGSGDIWHITSFAESGDGSIWVGANPGGLSRWTLDGDPISVVTRSGAPQGVSGSEGVTDLMVDESDVLWVATYGTGLHLLRPDGASHAWLPREEGPGRLSDERAAALHRASDGLIWVGTWGGGLNMLDPNKSIFASYLPDGTVALARLDVTDMRLDPDGQRVWITAFDAGLLLLDLASGTLAPAPVQPDSRADAPWSSRVLLTRSGHVIVGSWGFGLHVQQPGGTTFDVLDLGPDHARIRALYETRAGDVWLGTDGGAGRIELDLLEVTWHALAPVTPNAPPPAVYAFTEDRAGRLWVGSSDGVSVLDRDLGSFINVHPEGAEGLGNRVIAIHQDRAGVFWLGTDDSGLIRMTLETGRPESQPAFEHHVLDGRLTSPTVTDIVETPGGELWLLTNRGVTMYDPDTDRVRRYFRSDGLATNELIAGVLTPDGRVVIGGAGGVTVFRPTDLDAGTPTPSTIITEVRRLVEGRLERVASAAPEIVVRHNSSVLGVEFAILDFRGPRAAAYEYRLVGQSQTWIPIGDQRSLTFSNLAAGSYEFTVRGTNARGVDARESAPLRFRVLPPIWETLWFRTLVLALASAALWRWYLGRTERLRAHNVALRREITERERVEAERDSLEDQLLRSQKLEAIGTLVGGIAHDFNNLLVPILGFTELALDRPNQDEETAEYLNYISKAGSSARALVAQILSFSKGSDPTGEAAYLDVAVAEALDLLKASIPSTIEVRSTLDESIGPVGLDRGQVHQIVLNLAINATHAIQDDVGTISVTVAEAPDASVCRLTIEDSGTGMDSETLSRLFDPFYTTKASGEGTGLGLAVVHGLVTKGGGTIDVESRLGEGTRFTIELPVAGDRSERQHFHEVAIPGGGECVLIVDDEEAVLHVVAKMLERLGYEVLTAVGPHEALDVLRGKRTAIAVVLIDHQMPRMTGVGLRGEIRAIDSTLPVVMASADPDALVGAAGHGFQGTLRKPYRLEELSNSLRAAIETSE